MEQNKKLKMFKTFQILAAILGVVSIGLWVLMAVKVLAFSQAMVVLAGILTTLSLTAVLCMPWAKKMAIGKYKIAGFVFLILNAIAFCLLTTCIICLALIFDKLDKSTTFVFADYAGILNILKYSILIVLQILVANFIGNYVLRFKKKFILFQTVSYVSLLYMDVAVSILALSVTISDSGVKIDNFTGLLTNVIFWSGLALAFVVWAFLFRTVKKLDGFRLTNTYKENMKEEKENISVNANVEQTAAEQPAGAEPASTEATEVNEQQQSTNVETDGVNVATTTPVKETNNSENSETTE